MIESFFSLLAIRILLLLPSDTARSYEHFSKKVCANSLERALLPVCKFHNIG